jgi:hypothetical protein
MSKSIPVEARFEPDGTLRPTAFEWKGKRYNIESLGRQWEEHGTQHFLVMVSSHQVFELVYLQGENHWQLKRSPKDFKKHPFV